LYIEFSSSSGVTSGTELHLNGMTIGKVIKVRFQDDPRNGVIFDCLINEGFRVPGDVNAYIYSRGFVGGAYLELASDNKPPGNQRGMDWLPEGYTIKNGRDKGAGLVPDELLAKVDEIAKSFKSFGELSENLNRILAPATQPTSSPAATTAAGQTATAPGEQGVGGVLVKLNRTLDAFNTIIGSEDAQQDLRAIIGNLRSGTQAGTEAMTELKQFAADARETLKQIKTGAETVTTAAQTTQVRADELAGKLIEQADKMGQLLTTLNQAAAKVDQGEGTVGKMLNDPALYNNLLQASDQLVRTLRELQDVLDQWREQGVPIKVK
jgi:phospholipid/cholesterol/gamma-HCH transport system substrate-binding protein